TMTEVLAGRGFAVDRRIAADATQAGIRDGFQHLVVDARGDDGVVIYFSGHGHIAHVTSPEDVALPPWRFIVPTDYTNPSPGDFRGITALELSATVARLTDRTRNVTVILDCCHAGRMVRSDLKVKAWPDPARLDIAELIRMLRVVGLDPDRL